MYYGNEATSLQGLGYFLSEVLLRHICSVIFNGGSDNVLKGLQPPHRPPPARSNCGDIDSDALHLGTVQGALNGRQCIFLRNGLEVSFIDLPGSVSSVQGQL